MYVSPIATMIKEDLEGLSESERATCSDVNDFIGTDRW